MKTVKQNWIIGISGSDADDVFVYRVFGTKAQVKKCLVNEVKGDKQECEEDGYDDWEHGTTSTGSVEERPNGTLYAYGCWNNHHNDYTATPEMPVKELGKKTA